VIHSKVPNVGKENSDIGNYVYIGNLINQWNGLNSDTHHVYIFRSKSSENSSKIVENLVKKVPAENPISILNTSKFDDSILRPGTLRIILSKFQESVNRSAKNSSISRFKIF
jgi:precorrin-4 methylase